MATNQAMPVEQLAHLRNLLLAQLGALCLLFRSPRWQRQLASASEAHRRGAGQLERAVRARFERLQRLSLEDLGARLEILAASLTDAGDAVAQAVEDARDIPTVLAAGSRIASLADALAPAQPGP